jgi:hypothetical protein
MEIDRPKDVSEVFEAQAFSGKKAIWLPAVLPELHLTPQCGVSL